MTSLEIMMASRMMVRNKVVNGQCGIDEWQVASSK
jgi:hypothetical protein